MKEDLKGAAVRMLPVKVTNLAKEMGFTAFSPEYMVWMYTKRIYGGEMTVWITRRDLVGEPVNRDLLTFCATWSPEKKFLGKYRKPNYWNQVTLQDTEVESFSGMKESQILEKVKSKIEEYESRIENFSILLSL